MGSGWRGRVGDRNEAHKTSKYKFGLNIILLWLVIDTNLIRTRLQISKHHLISQREHKIMDYTIVSGNKPSSVAINQKHAKVFIEML